MAQITLVCWQCGKKMAVEADPPRFGFELAAIAKKAGYLGYMDIAHSRSLIFCQDACVQKARKKDGSFRLRPLKERTVLTSNCT